MAGARSCRSQRAEQLKAQGKGETSHISAKPVLTHSKYYDFLPHPSRTKRNHYIFSTSACQFNSRATATHPPPLNLNMWALAYEGNSRSCFQLWSFPQPPLQEEFHICICSTARVLSSGPASAPGGASTPEIRTQDARAPSAPNSAAPQRRGRGITGGQAAKKRSTEASPGHPSSAFSDLNRRFTGGRGSLP